MSYEIRKTAFGRLTVTYQCPKCSCRLINPLSSAGKADHCPECKTVHSVPGIKERERIEAEASAKKIAAEEQAAAKRKSAERLRTEKARIADLERQASQLASQNPTTPDEDGVDLRPAISIENNGPEEIVKCPFCHGPKEKSARYCPNCGQLTDPEILQANVRQLQTLQQMNYGHIALSTLLLLVALYYLFKALTL